MKIEIYHLSKQIKDHLILNDITLQMRSGYVYGFQGINGSGKTMLMRAVLGLIRPTRGFVEIDGKILGKDADFPDNAGFLLEHPAFLNRYSGFYNLKMIADTGGMASDEDICRLIWRVGLDPYDSKKYGKYSLGMKQRLGIAGALLGDPGLIILDEPTNGLDSDGVRVVQEIIRDEKKRGALVILSCHDQAFLEAAADKIFVIEEGKITKFKAAAEAEYENEK